MSKALQKLIQTHTTLKGSNGCPWDRKQTIVSLKETLLEEANEVAQAIEKEDHANLKEELGDLLYNILFISKLAEEQKLFTFEEVMEEVNAKLIRRHPHVFGDVKVKDAEEVMRNWKRIKEEEKGGKHG